MDNPIYGVNLKLLKEQKNTLVEVIDVIADLNRLTRWAATEAVDNLDGLLHMCDAIQDYLESKKSYIDYQNKTIDLSYLKNNLTEDQLEHFKDLNQEEISLPDLCAHVPVEVEECIMELLWDDIVDPEDYRVLLNS